MDVGDMYTDHKIRCTLQTLLFKEFVMKFIDRTAQVFGKLTVIEQAGRNKLKKVLWRCKCECGNEAVVTSGSLVTGNTTSCGCIVSNFKHGGSGKGSYNTWRAMMRRCYNQKDKDYPRWGGRGVTVYAPWHDYASFAKDVGEPTGAETFDRIDTAGNYEPRNVRWATPTTQARNIRVPKTNKTGITGVLFHGGYYYAAITVKKKKYYSSVCKSIKEAALARKQLEQIHWGAS
jgi:hypothetical protein